ncbi:hypothetical protein BABINDRAFT_7681 [Babjeviella inositovora NRRL Y-12698]|uniref:PXA domain-containing protein n=1 Tax=Babjeviella inositovora NRRL Y-12698 TaxID=984486 RepID=A0A1E3QR94_9ASCO|nr:uncharacterized protein BABINDRAFT_7681 [Babjeviella inositovora NRRL Y-12698]ODQ80215.1 hypothetical protein BABINDRAFT_7681 [Babjeviella inositovora NRRL Y-12698]
MELDRHLEVITGVPAAKTLSPSRYKRHSRLSKSTKSPSLKQKEKTGTAPKDSAEYLNDLIRSIYLPYVPSKTAIVDVLPALASSASIDRELLAFLGLFIRQFIQGWYSKLSSDEDFLLELVANIAHITRGIEERGRKLDPVMVLDKVCLVLNNHLVSLRTAREVSGTNLCNHNNMVELYKILCGHLAVPPSDATTQNEARSQRSGVYHNDSQHLYLSVLVLKVLKLALPPDLFDSPLALSFLKNLLSDLVLSSVVEKLSENYFWYEILINISRGVTGEKHGEKVPPESNEEKQNPTISIRGRIISLSRRLSHLVAYTTSIRDSGDTPARQKDRIPISTHSVFTLAANLFSIQAKRPLVYGLVCFLPVHNRRMNHLFHNITHHLMGKFLKESTAVQILSKLRSTMFPTDEEMGPSRIDPTVEERETIKANAIASVSQMVSKYPFVQNFLYGSQAVDLMPREIEQFVGAFDNKTVNKLLIMQLLDCIIGELFPELYSQIE